MLQLVSVLMVGGAVAVKNSKGDNGDVGDDDHDNGDGDDGHADEVDGGTDEVDSERVVHAAAGQRADGGQHNGCKEQQG